jgi:hypothetical protein
MGRWIHDPASGVVASLVDIPTDTPPPFVIEIVGELVSAAESVASSRAAEHELDGLTALTLVGGNRRIRANCLVNHLRDTTYPAGASNEVPSQLLPLIQDELVSALPEWVIERYDVETWADRDGTTFVLKVTEHAVAGYGLMIALGGNACRQDDGLHYAEQLNCREAFFPGGSLGCWTFFTHPGAKTGGLEYRVFLAAALLDAGTRLEAQRFVDTVVQSVARRAGPVIDRPPVVPNCPTLLRPCWP